MRQPLTSLKNRSCSVAGFRNGVKDKFGSGRLLLHEIFPPRHWLDIRKPIFTVNQEEIDRIINCMGIGDRVSFD